MAKCYSCDRSLLSGEAVLWDGQFLLCPICVLKQEVVDSDDVPFILMRRNSNAIRSIIAEIDKRHQKVLLRAVSELDRAINEINEEVRHHEA